MKIEVYKDLFVELFEDTRPDNFSRGGLYALFDYLDRLEEDTGEDTTLDVIGICSEYSEYENIEEIKDNYNDVDSLEDLLNMTSVIEFDGGIIIQDF